MRFIALLALAAFPGFLFYVVYRVGHQGAWFKAFQQGASGLTKEPQSAAKAAANPAPEKASGDNQDGRFLCSRILRCAAKRC